MVGVGAPATDWANDGLFGDGWHLLGIGSSEYGDAADSYTAAMEAIGAYYELDTEADGFEDVYKRQAEPWRWRCWMWDKGKAYCCAAERN